ncbi:hypothetical protein LCGC14_2227670 [marine sediment metagenome]|uniref:Uncharacterized protein n=1 Tax=marine sediment metagenome TaxID=412755 RepID=A0A0F9D992_9ZZZZ
MVARSRGVRFMRQEGCDLYEPYDNFRAGLALVDVAIDLGFSSEGVYLHALKDLGSKILDREACKKWRRNYKPD